MKRTLSCLVALLMAAQMGSASAQSKTSNYGEELYGFIRASGSEAINDQATREITVDPKGSYRAIMPGTSIAAANTAVTNVAMVDNDYQIFAYVGTEEVITPGSDVMPESRVFIGYLNESDGVYPASTYAYYDLPMGSQVGWQRFPAQHGFHPLTVPNDTARK